MTTVAKAHSSQVTGMAGALSAGPYITTPSPRHATTCLPVPVSGPGVVEQGVSLSFVYRSTLVEQLYSVDTHV